MTEQELSEIEARAKVCRDHAEMPAREWPVLHEDIPALLAEVRRLRAVVDHLREFRDYSGPDVRGAWSELEKHLAELDAAPNPDGVGSGRT